jgi:hypothetical protein
MKEDALQTLYIRLTMTDKTFWTNLIRSMDDSSYWLNFDPDKNDEIYHYSLKEHP